MNEKLGLRLIKKQCKRIINKLFYNHGSLHRDSVLIKSNKMQQYAGKFTLHVSGVHRTHYQEYKKL
jgi:hypothetical protein